MKKYLFFTTVSILTLLSCSKPDKFECEVNVASIAGTYKLVSLTYVSGGQEADVFKDFDDCEKDNLFIFNSDGTYKYTDAGLSCNSNEDINSTWSLQGKSLIVDGMATTIKKFNCSQLTVEGNGVMTAGDKLVAVYNKQ
jgi:hypothetical protein